MGEHPAGSPLAMPPRCWYPVTMNANQFLGLAPRLALAFLLLVGQMVDPTAAQPNSDQAAPDRWAIALHGGAGRWSPEMDPQQRQSLEQSLQQAMDAGTQILDAGGSALDAVEAVVVALEDDPQFNAGKGAVFTQAGTHELDASIMDGATLRCGGVAGVKRQKNPIRAARLVMERTAHVLLAGDSADTFALENGCAKVTQDYFYTDRRFRALQRARDRTGLEPLESPAYCLPSSDPADDRPRAEDAGDTVGCVALDVHGNLAAATSTGGLTGKLPGRIGDSPICGAGNYANNKSCAVSGTGRGEEFIRHSVAARVAWLIEQRGFTADEAVRHCLNEVLQPGQGGIIAVDHQGNVSMHATTGAMPRAMADSSGRSEFAIWFDR